MSRQLEPKGTFEEDRDGGGLADDISDVIEEHGRGLDAEGISTALEAVLADYEEADAPERFSHAKLERELRRYVEHYDGDVDRAEVLETLRELADELRTSSLEPTVDIERDDQVSSVILAFDCAFALQQTLPQLFDIRGYFVETDASLTYLDEIKVRVAARPIDVSVEIDGCVTRTAPNGFTVEVWQPPREVERRLRRLPDLMRDARV